MHTKQINTKETTFTIAHFANAHFNVDAVIMRRILILSDIKNINKRLQSVIVNIQFLALTRFVAIPSLKRREVETDFRRKR